MTSDIKAFNYYAMHEVDAAKIQESFKCAVDALGALSIPKQAKAEDFVKTVFELEPVADLLIFLSRLPVFDKDFAHALSHDLDLLALAKKLKFYTNLPISQNLLLVQQVLQCFDIRIEGYDSALIDLVRLKGEFSAIRFKDYVQKDGASLGNSKKYVDNNEALVTIDPHAVYPTSIYRTCDGLTLATKDSQTIEAVMSTTLTTTIKIVNGVLKPENRILADVYRPLGRCVAIIDDKVVGPYGKELEAYFAHHGIDLIQCIHGGNEIDKDIHNVQRILMDLKNNGVARNEPILIMGGGVVADIGGFATSLYHRNTPYVMLCTSIVTGIDAGPSPRTCCDGSGFKNLYGAYHPPILTITDRSFWKTLHEGWIRHGIAEIIKMACVEDFGLFELIEQAGPRLIRTKFGTEGDTDPEFEKLCDLIIGKGMECYVRSEYGNLWETHQCRPHAFGHTWSPGYELPAGLLHGHAVSTCMGYGTYLAQLEGFMTEEEMARVLKLLSTMELSLWHDIMDNHDLVASANKKAHEKRGGNLCAPVPRTIGKCGYINEMHRDKLDKTLTDYKKICSTYARGGKGVDCHCHDVGLEDPSAVAGDAYKGLPGTSTPASAEVPNSYNEWIKKVQTDRNSDWQMNVQFEVAVDTERPPAFSKYTLFHDAVEKYAMEQTSLASENVRNVAKLTETKQMFSPCMVGALESQFLKMLCQIKGASRCLDVGTFTGMSALAMAEGIPADGKVVTLECDAAIGKAAQEGFDMSSVGGKIELRMGAAAEMMRKLKAEGQQFDMVFLDADKENYIEYFELALDGLLAEDGVILADNTMCALLYDSSDMRSQKLHEFNQHIKNDKRVEQVVLTLREGVTMIRRVKL